MSTTTTTVTMVGSTPSTTMSTLLLPPSASIVPQPTLPALEKRLVPRLLYRGAFSLPDSKLLLDGLTFTINLPADDPQASLKLLETPLPLALESMRGRQSLSFIGVQRMDDLYCDYSGGVTVHVHPRCILTCQLFEHNLCADPITSPSGRTDLGIRVRLGESDAYSTSSDIVIYGRPHPSTSILQLCVARVMPLPPPVPKPIARLRPPLPRPDDPTPRRPPVGFGGIARIGLGMKRSISAVKKDDSQEDGATGDPEGGPRKRAKKDGSSTLEVAKRPAPSRVKTGSGVFKVPPLPPSRRDRERPIPKASEPKRPPTNDEALPVTDFDEGGSELEKANKVIIKKAVVRQMSTIGINKQHPDFKDFFGHVYRGVSFALRAKLKASHIDKYPALMQRIDRLVQTHIDMYIEERDSGVEC